LRATNTRAQTLPFGASSSKAGPVNPRD
jgi:hypothetical protein